MKLLLLLLLSVSCGENNSKRCFTREEAILSCQAREIANTGVTANVARLLCEPYYPYAGCYNL
jgi:hypothetical protein